MKPFHSGGCLCGDIRYEVTSAPLDAGYCHCTQCRRSAGSPAVPWATVRRETFAFVKGTPASYLSSEKAERKFCARCGSALVFQYRGTPETLDFTLASLDDPNAIAPEYHIWTENRIPWFDTADSLPRYADRGPDRWE